MTPQEKLKTIQHFIARMPSLSTTVTKVLEICNDPGSSPNDLNRVISLDPVLTGQVLKLINSAYYGLPNKIASLTRAIIMLGLNTVKNLVLATSILSSFKGNSALRGTAVDQFWEHSLRVGVAGRVLSRLFNVPVLDQEEYFVTGLLHDLGKLPIMTIFPVLYQQIGQLADEQNLRSFEAESQVLGFDHCHVNRLIFTKWKLGRNLYLAAALHHQPFGNETHEAPLPLRISLANEIVQRFTRPVHATSVTGESPLDRLTHACRLTLDHALDLEGDIEDQVQQARVFLNVAGKG